MTVKVGTRTLASLNQMVVLRREGCRVLLHEDGLSGVFAALADPTRRDIVARLAVGDATVGQLAAPYAMSVQAVSKHLRVLEEAGLVSTSQAGRERPRHLEAEALGAMTTWLERYRRTAEERFRRLDALLAEQDGTDQHPHEEERA